MKEKVNNNIWQQWLVIQNPREILVVKGNIYVTQIALALAIVTLYCYVL